MSINVKENSKILALSTQKMGIKNKKFKKFKTKGKIDQSKRSHFSRFSKNNISNLNESDKFRITTGNGEANVNEMLNNIELGSIADLDKVKKKAIPTYGSAYQKSPAYTENIKSLALSNKNFKKDSLNTSADKICKKDRPDEKRGMYSIVSYNQISKIQSVINVSRKSNFIRKYREQGDAPLF